MENPPEPTENTRGELSKAGAKAYTTAFRTIVIGGIVSFLFVLLAILTLFTEGGDSAGLGFFIFAFLALSVFTVCSFISLAISLIGIIKGTTALSQNKNSKEEITDGITKNIGLILGIILLALIAYKLLT